MRLGKTVCTNFAPFAKPCTHTNRNHTQTHHVFIWFTHREPPYTSQIQYTVCYFTILTTRKKDRKREKTWSRYIREIITRVLVFQNGTNCMNSFNCYTIPLSVVHNEKVHYSNHSYTLRLCTFIYSPSTDTRCFLNAYFQPLYANNGQRPFRKQLFFPYTASRLRKSRSRRI